MPSVHRESSNTQPLDAVPIRLDGRVVGCVVGSEFRRTLQERHVLRYPRPAIAVSEQVLDAAERLGAIVGVWTLPSGAEACMGLQAFRALATRIDRGHGVQLSVPIAAFPLRVPAGRLRVPDGEPAQLALFDG